MSSVGLTDKQRMLLSLRQYDVMTERQAVYLEGEVIYGYVSEVNHKKSGEDSYVITDIPMPENPTEEDFARVKNITILFQGSTFDRSKLKETLVDWIPNNARMTFNHYAINTGPSKQLQTASDTMQAVLKKYPNAQIDVYGHSLGLMVGYGSLTDIKAEDVHRIRGVYLHNGPNPYKSFSKLQIENLKRLSDKIHVYIDTNDIVGFGYNTTNVIGNIYRIQTKDIFWLDQHNLKGYEFDAADNFVNVDGTLATEDIRLKHIDINNDGVVDFKIDSIDIRVRDLFTKGLFLATSSQKIQLNKDILEQLANNLEETSRAKLANIKRITSLCSEKNNKINRSFDSRKTQVTEQVREVIKLSGMSYLIDGLYDSVGVIMKNKDILEEGVSHSELERERFNSSQTPLVNGETINFNKYNFQLDILRHNCEQLLERVNKEKTVDVPSMFSGGRPSIMKSWQVIEEASKELLKKVMSCLKVKVFVRERKTESVNLCQLS